MKYSKHFNASHEQSEKARTDQVENNAGGFVFKIGDMERLTRFLILGSEGGTYYVREREHTLENAKCVVDCWDTRPQQTAALIVDVSVNGRAPKNDAAIFALAIGAASDNVDARALALNALQSVCRTGTHLFKFADNVKQLRGWGRALRNAVANWYTDKSTDKLAYQLVKYQGRDGWTNADLLRLAHPCPKDETVNELFRWTLGQETDHAKLPLIVQGFERAKRAQNVSEVVDLIREYGLTHEMIPTSFKTDKSVWAALLEKMPMGAMLRNLGNMSKVGLLVESNFTVVNTVTDRLNETAIHKARIHPMDVLVAHKVYSTGRGFRGRGEWPVVPSVVDALDDAFYLAFDNVQPTGKRLFVGLDVSGSMGGSPINAMANITAREASVAMSLLHLRTEKNVILRGFTSTTGYFGRGWNNGDQLTDLQIGRKTSLKEAVNKVSNLPFGGTDCALPMLTALRDGIEVDAFIIYTDNETWAGTIHPFEALRKYRKEMKIDARLIVVGMTATEFSIADPSDPGMLDVVGFDTTAPSVMASFLKGEF